MQCSLPWHSWSQWMRSNSPKLLSLLSFSFSGLRFSDWVAGWVGGTIFAEETSEKCQRSCCCLAPGRNAWWKKWRRWSCLVGEMKCQILPDPSKWDHPMHTRPIPSFSDEPFHALKKGWNIQCGQNVQKSGKSGPKMSDRKIERLWKIKMSTELRREEKSPSITKL